SPINIPSSVSPIQLAMKSNGKTNRCRYGIAAKYVPDEKITMTAAKDNISQVKWLRNKQSLSTIITSNKQSNNNNFTTI
ncbi:hypothetical protein PV327_007459, partial [Microctonus hyperodae]